MNRPKIALFFYSMQISNIWNANNHFNAYVLKLHFLTLTVVERAGQSDRESQSYHAQAFGGSDGGTSQQTHPPHSGQAAAEEDLRGTVEPS